MTNLLKLHMGVTSSQSYLPQNSPVQNLANYVATPSKDTVEVSNRPVHKDTKTLSKTQKIFVGLGAFATAALGAIYGIKNIRLKVLKTCKRRFRKFLCEMI